LAALDDDLPDALVCYRLQARKVRVRFQPAAVDPEITDSANLRRHRLEHKQGRIAAERLRVIRCGIRRAGKIIDNGVEQRLYADILAARAAQYRDELARARSQLDDRENFLV